jgi:ribosomal protein L37AE/L43A
MEATQAGYTCKECGMAVIVRNGEVIRACSHKGTVIAGMSAVATGESKLEQTSGKQP